MQREQTGGDAASIAQAFVAARRSGTALRDFPGEMPGDLTTAYRVQDAALALVDDRVAGWKVGKIAPAIDGVDRLTGPIFAAQVFEAGTAPRAMPVFADGFAAAEAEFLLRIGTAPEPDRTNYTMEQAIALIDAVHVGIEIASSPFPGINSHGPSVTVADFGNNNGLVIGEAIDGWQDAGIVDWPVALDINGEQAGAASAATMLDGPFGAARYLFAHMGARGIALTPGQWISTGAVTGVHQVRVGDRIVARFGEGYTVECTIAAQ